MMEGFPARSKPGIVELMIKACFMVTSTTGCPKRTAVVMAGTNFPTCRIRTKEMVGRIEPIIYIFSFRHWRKTNICTVQLISS